MLNIKLIINNDNAKDTKQIIIISIMLIIRKSIFLMYNIALFSLRLEQVIEESINVSSIKI